MQTFVYTQLFLPTDFWLETITVASVRAKTGIHLRFILVRDLDDYLSIFLTRTVFVSKHSMYIETDSIQVKNVKKYIRSHLHTTALFSITYK